MPRLENFSPATTQQLTSDELRLRAFQADRGWYEDYWLTPGASQQPAIWYRVAFVLASGFWAVVDGAATLRRAVNELPSDVTYPRANFRIDVFRTWLGGPGLHG